MLGKTNITALQEGAIVTEIADYGWMKQDIGITDNFIQVICKNGYLVGITSGGKIAHTKDGEVWEISEVTHSSLFGLYDIEWNGEYFFICGWHIKDGRERGIIFKTTDFSAFEILDSTAIDNLFSDLDDVSVRYSQILYSGSKYILAVVLADYNRFNHSTYAIITDFSTYSNKITVHLGSIYAPVFAKKSDSILCSYIETGSVTYSHPVTLKIVNQNVLSKTYEEICGQSRSYQGGITVSVPVFSCRDSFYASSQYGNCSEGLEYDYSLARCSEGTGIKLSNGTDFGFISGCYFSGKYVFLNKTSILVFSKESEITGKTLDDLIDIGSETELSIIIGAFNKLFIFGNGGLILKSTNEVNNNEAITVQYLSAKQALAQSKTYTDEQISTLEARVSALEAFHQEETT